MFKQSEVQRSKPETDRQIKGNILVTSSSKKVSLVQAVQKASQKLNPAIQVIAGDLDETSITRFVADDFWKMPPIIDTEIDVLIVGCKERCIYNIIPTRDGELLFWAKHKSLLAQEGIHVAVPSFDSVRICLDKLAFAQFGVKHKLPFITANEHLDNVNTQSYVVKERYGSGSQKIGLNLSKEDALIYSKKLRNPIYQTFIKGKEISIDAWFSRSHILKGLVLRSRDKIVNGEAQVTTTFRNKQIEDEVIKILQELSLSGHIVLQALIDENQGIHIIECNPRFGGASTASILVGLDTFYWSLLESYDIDLSEYPFCRTKSDFRQVRISTDIYISV